MTESAINIEQLTLSADQARVLFPYFIIGDWINPGGYRMCSKASLQSLGCFWDCYRHPFDSLFFFVSTGL